MSDDTPTVRFEQTPDAESGDSGGRGGDGGKTSKTLIVVLSIIGGILLIAVVVLLTLLFSRGFPGSAPAAMPSESAGPSETPSASPSETPSSTPSASPSESASPSPSTSPPTTGPVFTSFSPANNTSVGCTSDSGQVPLTFTWASTGATEAAIGVGTTDAFAGAYETGLPPSGTYTDISYQCSEASQIYTVSIRGTSGQTNKTVTLKR